MNYKVEAVVLKSKDIKDVDRIYTVFSREKGKLKIVGKGVRKPTAKLASGVEPITLSEIFLIKAKWLDKLTGVIIVNQYARIKSDEKKIVGSQVLFDILDKLTNEKEPNEAIYESLLYYLQLLETGALPEQGLRVLQTQSKRKGGLLTNFHRNWPGIWNFSIIIIPRYIQNQL